MLNRGIGISVCAIEPDLTMIEALISFMLRSSPSADPSTQTGRGLGKSFLDKDVSDWRRAIDKGDNFREGLPRRSRDSLG